MSVGDAAVLTRKQWSFTINTENIETGKKIQKIKRFPSKKSKSAGGFSKAQNRESSAEIRSVGVFAIMITFTDSLYITKWSKFWEMDQSNMTYFEKILA